MWRPHRERLVPVGVNISGGTHYSSSNAEAQYNEHVRRIKSGGGCGDSVTTLLVMDYVRKPASWHILPRPHAPSIDRTLAIVFASVLTPLPSVAASRPC